MQFLYAISAAVDATPGLHVQRLQLSAGRSTNDLAGGSTSTGRHEPHSTGGPEDDQLVVSWEIHLSTQHDGIHQLLICSSVGQLNNQKMWLHKIRCGFETEQFTRSDELVLTRVFGQDFQARNQRKIIGDCARFFLGRLVLGRSLANIPTISNHFSWLWGLINQPWLLVTSFWC